MTDPLSQLRDGKLYRPLDVPGLSEADALRLADESAARELRLAYERATALTTSALAENDAVARRSHCPWARQQDWDRLHDADTARRRRNGDRRERARLDPHDVSPIVGSWPL